jgi:pyruvate formate lyase activating enzyme
MNVDDVVASFVEATSTGSRRIDFIDGVVFSGGEALLQAAAVKEITECLKTTNTLIGVQTNGIETGALDGLTRLRLIDAVFLDIKAPLTLEKYQNVSPGITQEAIDHIGASLHRLAQRRLLKLIKYLEIRTTVFQGMNDTSEDIATIMKCLNYCDAFVLQQGRVELAPDQTLKMVSREDLLKLAKKVKKKNLVQSVVVRTHTHRDEKVQ